MAVIGRLDEQVDALLIKPLDKKRTREPAAQEDEQATNEKPERAPQGTQMHEVEKKAEDTSSAEDAASSVREDASSQNERNPHARLPVWLL